MPKIFLNKMPTRLPQSDRVLALRLWQNGMDTHAIAARMAVDESQVYNTLYVMREENRRIEGDLFDAYLKTERAKRGEVEQG